MLSELVGMFCDDVASGLSGLKEAVGQGDASSKMGARGLAAVCSKLEKVGASGDLAAAPALIERLEAEFDRARPALEAEAASR